MLLRIYCHPTCCGSIWLTTEDSKHGQRVYTFCLAPLLSAHACYPVLSGLCCTSTERVRFYAAIHFMFQVEVSEPREVGWWALQWGAHAEVLEPESLRQEMAEMARALPGV